MVILAKALVTLYKLYYWLNNVCKITVIVLSVHELYGLAAAGAAAALALAAGAAAAGARARPYAWLSNIVNNYYD